MFARQWFHPNSQQGLRSKLLEYEKALQLRQFDKAWKVLLSDQACLTNKYLIRQSHRLNHASQTDGSRPIRVASINFWGGFSFQDSALYHFLGKTADMLGAKIEVSFDLENADIILCSCFPGKQVHLPRQATYLLYLGENVRPSYTDYDYSFTCDLPEYGGRNCYLPVWVQYIHETLGSGIQEFGFSDKLTHISKLYQSQALQWSKRSDAIVFIGNNFEPMRASVLTEFAQLGYDVEIYGSQFRPVDKFLIYGRCKYIFCPENSFTPGYVTEKILDASLSGAKIIYWGGDQEKLSAIAPGSMLTLCNSGINHAELKSFTSRTSQPADTKKFMNYFLNCYDEIQSRCIRSLTKVLSIYNSK